MEPTLREHVATGIEYLDLATKLLQRARLEDPTAGLWEAGDVQWWWRRDRPSDRAGQTFWLDDTGAPVAAVVFTDWGDTSFHSSVSTWSCDPLVLPSNAETMLKVVWSRALQRIDSLALDAVDVIARDDDTKLQALLADAGFASTEVVGVLTWMRAIERARPTPLPKGFRLRDRTKTSDRPHHMIPRNGDHIAERLLQTSLYRPDLDLFVETSDGEPAAYGMFWWHPITGVGLVEPMRTMDEYQRLGLGRHILTSGLDRLTALGATRLKIGYGPDNVASGPLYRSVGFRPESASRAYSLQPR
jgi:GNAT superfamily N-acetyltransferase